MGPLVRPNMSISIEKKIIKKKKERENESIRPFHLLLDVSKQRKREKREEEEEENENGEEEGEGGGGEGELFHCCCCFCLSECLPRFTDVAVLLWWSQVHSFFFLFSFSPFLFFCCIRVFL